jgi:hypothetical protein
MTELEGWFQDPWAKHEARWFSEGRATSLVRDGKEEGSDPPPESPPVVQSPAPVVGPRRDDEIPERIFRGQPFEQDFKGSLGYGQPDAPMPSNWTDRLIIPVVTFLRPSQFGKPGYWLHVLWISVLSLVITAVLLLLVLR